MERNITVLKGKPYPLGMTVTGKRECNLAAVLQGKEECGVVLYPKDGSDQIRIPFGNENKVGNIYCMKLSGIRVRNFAYNFYAGEEIITDPYAKQILGNEKWGEKVDPELCAEDLSEDFDWEEDTPLMTPLCDSIIYQLHVRGFTKHPSSRVKKKGTFAGIAEKIPYLKTLGITAVELMPAYEFTELESAKRSVFGMAEAKNRYMELPAESKPPRINYWGFKKGYYFAPKASYSSTKSPSLEFKCMVKALHESGIEVIMQFYFPKEIRQGFILEVLKYWVYEYHIDGVHLLGDSIPTTLVATYPLLSNTKLFYYGFNCHEIYGSSDVPAYKNLACYQDDFLYDMRRYLKGDEDMLGAVLAQLKKNPAQTGVVNYIANYEGFTLADLVCYERKHNEANGEEDRDGNPYNASWNCGVEGKSKKKTIEALRAKQMRNAMMLLLFAQGTPMIVAGDEFGHSKDGNNNSWCQDNEVNWLNWNQTRTNKEFLDFVKAAITLRRSHPILHKPDELTMMDFIACGFPDLSWHDREAWRLSIDRISREAGVMYCGCYAKVDRQMDDDFFYIAYNMHWEEKELALPQLKGGLHWEKVMDSADASTASDGEILEKKIMVPARSIQILKSFGKPVKEGKKVEGITAF
ncbi:MAG: hypothetical protein IJ390_06650 [Lachnospiraceae bacterium]|nr:hypothetical protein [Lachnospiraceae bacterium]